MADENNSNERSDLMAEAPPFAEDSSVNTADADLIMNTFFGSDAPKKSGGDQEQGAQPSPANSSDGNPAVAAPSAGASVAAKGSGGEPQELPPVPEPPASQQEQQGTAGQPSSQSPAQGAQPSAPATPAAPASGLTAEERLQMQNDRAALAALKEQNQQLLDRLNGVGTAQPNAQPGTQPGQPEAAPPVSLVVPQDVFEAIFSEDNSTSQRGLNHLISAVATTAVTEAVKRSEKLIAERLQDFGQMSTVEQTRQQQEAEYFSKFEGHKNELFKPLIAEEARQMWAAMPNLPWNEESINALGARVNAKLTALGFPVGMQPASASADQQQQQQTSTGGQPPVVDNTAPKPAAMMDSGTRPPAGGGGDSNFIAATFG